MHKQTEVSCLVQTAIILITIIGQRCRSSSYSGGNPISSHKYATHSPVRLLSLHECEKERERAMHDEHASTVAYRG